VLWLWFLEMLKKCQSSFLENGSMVLGAKRQQRCLLAPIFISFLLLSASAFAQEDASKILKLSLSETANKVVQHLPQLKIQEYAVLAAQASKKEAYSSYLPSVGLGFSATRGNDPVYVFSSLLKQRSFSQENFAVPSLNKPDPFSNYQSALELSLPIFSAFQTEGRVRSADFAVKASQSLRENSEQEAMLTAIIAYTRVLSLEKMIAVAQDIVTISEQAVKEAENLQSKGMVLGCDYLTARATIAQMKRFLETTKFKLAAAYSSLSILMGLSQEEKIALIHTIPPEQFPEIDIVEFQKDLLTLRKDAQAAKYNVDLSQSELAREKNNRLPNISAFARAESNTNQWDDSAENYTAGLQLRMNIFEPSLSPRIDRLQAEVKRSKSFYLQVEESLKDSLQQTLSEYQSQNEILKLTKQSLMDARQAGMSIGDLYRVGKRSIADFLKAQTYQLELENTYWDIRFGAYINFAKLFFLSGKLNSENMQILETMLAQDNVSLVEQTP